MNPRERFNDYMRLQTVDRPPYLCWNGVRDYTVERWYGEGLLRDLEGYPNDEVRRHFGFDGPTSRKGTELWKSLGPGSVRVGQQGWYGVPFVHKPLPPLGTPMAGPPPLGWYLIQETDRYRIYLINGGPTKMKQLKGDDRGKRIYYDYPEISRQNFEMMKKFYDPYHPARYPSEREKRAHLSDLTKDFEYPVVLGVGAPSLALEFFGGHLWQEVLYSYYDQPVLVAEIIEFFTDQMILSLENVLQDCTIDVVNLSDDHLCYSHGPWISPEHFRSFMLPNYRRLVDFLRSRGVDLILGYFGGNITELLPMFLDVGYDGFTHLSVENGMDAPALRREYGRNLRIIDNIGYRILLSDDRIIKKELERKLPLVEEGGYIPCIDEEVTVDVPFERFVYFDQQLKAGLCIGE